MARFSAATFYAQTIPGIERIAWQELETKLERPRLLRTEQLRDQNGLLFFAYHGDPKTLLDLRTTEDVFYLVAYEPNLPADRSGLRAIEQTVARSKLIERGFGIYRQVCGTSKKRITFRIVARKQGEHRYRRIDAQKAAERGLLQRYGSQWKLVENDADIELWLTLLHTEVFLGLRLSTKAMRQRTYKVSHLPASLRPTVAAAMVLLSDPQPNDVFLDPMCGAGTLLIERALAGRYKLLLGGDISPQAVEATLENIGPRYKPIEIRQWDATDLPLADGSVDKVVTNPPFGAQLGTRAGNQALYPKLLSEIARVVRPGGKSVVLTPEHRLMQQVLSNSRALKLEGVFPIALLGFFSRIYVLRRV